uniref:Uncharacterized protein n=1 Tax=Arundo donax TaxID=35708 RepID=A0A0A9APK2_ARUDO
MPYFNSEICWLNILISEICWLNTEEPKVCKDQFEKSRITGWFKMILHHISLRRI